MSKIAFGKDNAASLAGTPEVVDQVPANALPVNAAPAVSVPATIPQTTTAVAAPSSNAFHDDENIDPRDLQLPRVNIVQKVGDLSNTFNPGELLLDGSLILAKAPDKADLKNLSDPVNIVVIGFQSKRFVEKVEGGGQGVTLNSEAEVVAANGTTDFNEAKRTNKKLFQHYTTALILIEQPAGDESDYFSTQIDGKNYALALWGMKGTAYTNAAKPLMTQRKIGKLKPTGYRGGLFTVQTKLEKYGPNFAYIPVVKFVSMTSDGFRNGLKELGL